jgi:hypothetical protein
MSVRAARHSPAIQVQIVHVHVPCLYMVHVHVHIEPVQALRVFSGMAQQRRLGVEMPGRAVLAHCAKILMVNFVFLERFRILQYRSTSIL